MRRLQATVIFLGEAEIGEFDHSILWQYKQMYKSAPKCNRVMEVSMIYTCRSRTERFDRKFTVEKTSPFLIAQIKSDIWHHNRSTNSKYPTTIKGAIVSITNSFWRETIQRNLTFAINLRIILEKQVFRLDVTVSYVHWMAFLYSLTNLKLEYDQEWNSHYFVIICFCFIKVYMCEAHHMLRQTW